MSHWHLGRGLAAQGESLAAAAEFRTAVHGSFSINHPPQEYAVAVNTMLAANDLPVVRSLYESWAAVDRGDPQILASLAAVQAALGDQEASLLTLRRAIDLDPSLLSEVPAFLQKYDFPADTVVPQKK